MCRVWILVSINVIPITKEINKHSSVIVSSDLHVQQLLVLYANRCKTLVIAFPETGPNEQRGVIVSVSFLKKSSKNGILASKTCII